MAETSEQKLAADMAIAELETRLAITQSDQTNFVTRMIRPLFALPFIIFVWKIVVWDTVLGFGVTPDISAGMWSIMQAIIYAYFGGRTLEKVLPYVFRGRR